MADLYEPDLGTVYYRSRDPIKNFKIKVTLRKVTSTSIVPQATLEKYTSEGQLKQKQDQPYHKDVETHIFAWQQKVFSQREFDKYLHEQNVNTVIERKYHETILSMREKGRDSRKLFSYVMHDAFTNQKENVESLTTNPDERPTALGERLSQVRRRKTTVGKSREGGAGPGSFVPKANLVNLDPSNEMMKRNRVILTPEQTMHIMADLTPQDADREPTEEDEHVLCTIKVDGNGVISLKPDFNKNRTAYKIETDGLGRSVYEYVIENASESMSYREMDRERRMYAEFYQRHADNLKLKVGPEFEMPPPLVLRYYLLGEIVSAKNFEYDDLFVRYLVDVPANWRADYSNNLAGVTHSCRTKVENFDNVAYFSFPFELEMFYRNELPTKEERIPAWPKLYIEVCSLDTWSRFRVEGYGYADLPQVPGSHSINIQCWRPLGNGVTGELRRFFIGGSPELEDPTYAAIPSSFEGTRLSKYGFRTESTGEVAISISTVLQSQSFLQKLAKKKERDNLFSNLGSALDYNQIKLVLDAFNKAHDRMVTARESVLKDFKDLSIGPGGDVPEEVIRVENPTPS